MSRRRYRIGNNPEYDAAFDNAKQHKSSILSPQNVQGTHAELMQTESGCQTLVRMLQGNEKHEYVDDRGNTNIAKIQRFNNKIDALMTGFENRNQRRLSEGKLPLQELPDELKKERLILEARLDIALEELDAVKEKLKTFQKKEQKSDDSMMLRYGPKGQIQLQGGIPHRVDGQKANVDKNGIPVIEDDRSPYDGMTVMAYQKLVVEPWNERREAYNRKLQKDYEAKIEKGLSPKPPKRLKPNATIKKESLPERPSDEAIEQFHQEIGLSELSTVNQADDETKKMRDEVEKQEQALHRKLANANENLQNP
jgi:hypothetical protein